MSIAQAQEELQHAWESSYSAERNAEAIEAISDKPIGWKIYHLLMRLSFRGIYFPQMDLGSWLKVLSQNRQTIFRLTRESIAVIFRRRSESRAHGERIRLLGSAGTGDEECPSGPRPFVVEESLPVVEDALAMSTRAN
jgi:hypothetical protein